MNIKNNKDYEPLKTSCLRRLGKWLGRFAIYYTILVGIIALNETNLVYPRPTSGRGNWNPAINFEEVTFISQDGTKLVAWYLPFPGATETALLCHGNGENVAQVTQSYGLKFQSTLNANILVFDYRGYGKSEGEPFEQGVLEDTEAAFDWLCEKDACKADDVILIGHSIGGGPAVHIASTRGGKALLLQRTFSSLVEPAARQYWFIPVTLIMRNRYPSAEKIAGCKVPLHQSHGNVDTLVPIDSGRKLHAASPASLKKFYEVDGKGHWDPLPRKYWDDVRSFVARINEQPRYQKNAALNISPVDPEAAKISPAGSSEQSDESSTGAIHDNEQDR